MPEEASKPRDDKPKTAKPQSINTQEEKPSEFRNPVRNKETHIVSYVTQPIETKLGDWIAEALNNHKCG